MVSQLATDLSMWKLTIRMGISEIYESRTTDRRSQATSRYVISPRLLDPADEVEIYSASPTHRRECTYYIAVGYYKLRNYSHARKFNGESFSIFSLPLLCFEVRSS
jgi:hypothetical protein